jgi:hypothetical protein
MFRKAHLSTAHGSGPAYRPRQLSSQTNLDPTCQWAGHIRRLSFSLPSCEQLHDGGHGQECSSTDGPVAWFFTTYTDPMFEIVKLLPEGAYYRGTVFSPCSLHLHCFTGLMSSGIQIIWSVVSSRCGSVYSARKESPLCEHRNTACEIYSTNPEMMEMMVGIYSSTRVVRPSLQMIVANVGIQE